MRTRKAREIAQRAHRGQLDPGGRPMADHVSRVATTTSQEARSVAWLHELLESTEISEQDLLGDGLTDEQLRALRLLVRPPGERSEAKYLGHISRIARSAGTGGALARAVKRADLHDRLQHPARRPDGWSPPYKRGLALLDDTSRHSETSSDLGGGRRTRNADAARRAA